MTREEQLDQFRRELDESIAKRHRELQDQQQAKRAKDAAHIKAAIAAKIDPNLNADDASKAKAYSRARSFMMLRDSYDLLAEVVRDPDCKLGMRISVALCAIQRAVGPPESPNSISVDMTEMTPVDIIDTLLQEHANGNISKEYIASTLGLLAAKVQGGRIEDLLRKVKEKKENAE